MRPKRKSTSHITEKVSLKIINEILPEYWTIREYKPDYGIDLSIELFEKNDSEEKLVFDTLGEHLFIQVKGTDTVDIANIKIKERKNIENTPLNESGVEKQIEVVKFVIDTNELFTIHRMGNTIPVILFVVNNQNKNIYFLCLNDYIDKVILAKEPDFFSKEQENKTIYIPTSNLITKNSNTLSPIYFYAKRPKFYSFFNKIGYQNNELNYCSEKILIERCKYYISILLRFDVWENNYWPIIDHFKQMLIKIKETDEIPIGYVEGFVPDNKEKEWEYGPNGNLYTQKEVLNFQHIHSLWNQMDNMKNVYETMCREWFLPEYNG
ncbi:DUF4365 domain-containing protein [uncultured Tenacibaculum sp.]|uniref:DUF4365 domain-containing protein n=1 Tax=uncultured Tenacibaculum sp. TaxID=174713 RepID=UPI0026141402|nr:DUF4365 domain-containing protein [uncultured Tenacibaculum sp.]